MRLHFYSYFRKFCLNAKPINHPTLFAKFCKNCIKDTVIISRLTVACYVLLQQFGIWTQQSCMCRLVLLLPNTLLCRSVYCIFKACNLNVKCFIWQCTYVRQTTVKVISLERFKSVLLLYFEKASKMFD